MRPKLYDTDAAKVPVTFEINADLHAKVQAAGLDPAALAERALAEALRERVREEIRQEIEACNRYIAEHGSFAEMLREEEAALEDSQAV